MNKILDQIASEFRTQQNAELEFRFALPPKFDFKSLINSCLKGGPKSSVQLTINIINNNEDLRESQSITTVPILKLPEGVRGNQKSEQYIIKQRLRQFNLDHAKIVLSSETPGEKSIPTNKTQLRFKARLSIDLEDSLKNWRLDITAVKSSALRTIGPQLERVRNQFFTNISEVPEKFWDTLPHDLVDSYELEAEYIGEPVISGEDIQNFHNLFVQKLFPSQSTRAEYRQVCLDFAKYIYNPEEVRRLSKSGGLSLKKIANQVIALNKNIYYSDGIYPLTNYYATPKADGERSLVLVSGNSLTALFGDRVEKQQITESVSGESLFDCEFIDGKFYAFDVILKNGEPVAEHPFKMRVEMLKDLPAPIVPKQFVLISKLTDLEGAKTSTFKTDGIILVEGYKRYVDTISYKWKPIEDTTIDFLARICPENMRGIYPYTNIPGKTLYLLFTTGTRKFIDDMNITLLNDHKKLFGNNYNEVIPVQFCPSVNPLAYLFWSERSDLDGKIVELGVEVDKLQDGNATREEEPKIYIPWRFVRFRTDRQDEPEYFGNHFVIAEITFMNLVDRFDFEDLLKPPSNYFSSDVSPIYKPGNAFRRFVISQLIAEMNGLPWVLDLAAGRGGDLPQYKKARIHHLLALEIDATALNEFIRRKFTIMKQSWKNGGVEYERAPKYERSAIAKYLGGNESPLVMHTMLADLKEPNETLIARMRIFNATPGMIDASVCNFAIHYMCDTVGHMENILNLVFKMLKPGGEFILTTMNGSEIYKRLAPLEQGQTLLFGDGTKYQIQKQYSGKLAIAGQNVAIKLPFSNELVSEPLCNINELIKIARKIGFNLKQNESFTTMLNEYQKMHPQNASNLSPEDIDYSSLFRFVVLVKKGKK